MVRYLYAEKIDDNKVEIHVEIDGNEYTVNASYFMLMNDMGINLLTHTINQKPV